MRGIKKSVLLMSFLLTMFIVSGCGVNEDKDLNKVVSDISSKVDLSNMKEGDSKALKRFFGLNSNQFDDFVLYIPKSTMDVEEMLIVKVKDKSQVTGLEDAIDSRVNKQIDSFSGYGPKQVALLQDYEVKNKGNYVFYTVSKDVDNITDAFKESIKN